MIAHRLAKIARSRDLGNVVVTAAALGMAAVAGAVTRRNQIRREAEALAQARFQALIEESKDFFFVIAPDGKIIYRSPSVVLAAGDNLPHHLDDLLDRLGGGDREIAKKVFFDTAQAVGTLKVPMKTELGDHWLSLHLNDQTANPAVGGIIITARDITKQELLAREMADLASIDSLTRLPNRRSLDLASSTALENCDENGTSAMLLLIDLDGFKGVNDTLGHPAGDQLLQIVAHRLAEHTRAGEIVARLGGDEFAVISEAIGGRSEALAAAERLLECLRVPIELEGQLIAVGATGGATVHDGDAEPISADDFLKEADVALYQAKRKGRGRIVFFEPSMAEEAEIEARLLREVEAGFERGEFSLAFQPLLTTSSSEAVSFEALMRWDSPTLGSVPPSTFIPIAERTGAIIAMGRWALLEACKQLQRWRVDFPQMDLSVSVNVSLRQIVDDDLPVVVAEVLAATGIEPRSLQLEITESLLARDPFAVAKTLEAVRKTGVSIALDDFGTGYSSLAQLQTLPVDCIKIDRAFISRLNADVEDDNSSVLQAMLDLARALDVSVIAEGVEKEEQLSALLKQRVELAQGFLFAKPLAPENVSDYLRRNSAGSDATKSSKQASQ